MSDGWYGPAIDNHAKTDGGTHTGPVTVGVLHTTESKSFYENVDSYFGHTSYPHFTAAVVTVKGKRVFRSWQHISIRKSARALKNLSGGVQTNREGVIQIEVVGSATDPFTDDPVMVEGLAALMRWIESQTEIKPQSSVKWTAYPESYGQKAKQRLSFDQWRAYNGWLGHQHVPENDHGDPGDIDIKRLLKKAPPAVKPAPPNPAPVLVPPPSKEIDMLIVLDPDGDKAQYVCDVDTKRHITQADRAVLIAAGVPYVAEKVSEANRREFLSRLVEVAELPEVAA